jgi:hypothetical protein
MNRWTLSNTEVVHLLREAKIRPGAGSPLGDLGSVPHAGFVAPIERQADALRAMTVLAGPETILGAMTFAPPEDPDYSWFYGAGSEPGLAYRGLSAEGAIEIVWPVDAPWLVRSLSTPLDLERGSDGEEISMVFDRSGFEALAVLADLAQEKSLLALLKRQGFSGMSFEAGDILECARRSGPSDDLRWTAPRFRLVSPIGLSFAEDDLVKGLRSLEAGGLVLRGDGAYTLSLPLGFACAQLSVTTGMSALSVRRKAKGPAGWTIAHVAAIRAGGGLWVLEFSHISATEFEVRMKSAGASEIYGRLKADLGYVPGPRFCRSCGGPLRTGAAFCPGCGGELR